uniref:Uncharacterized protein n=1 Tax=viral metagenome TaxID=1070528 RepID=A0A6M3L9C7_9ZZZZ
MAEVEGVRTDVSLTSTVTAYNASKTGQIIVAIPKRTVDALGIVGGTILEVNVRNTGLFRQPKKRINKNVPEEEEI